MTPKEIVTLITACKAGQTYKVPFSTTLYAGAVPHLNVLSFQDGHFQLVTKYAEFEPGHGYSVEMTETETWPEERLRNNLRYASVESVVVIL